MSHSLVRPVVMDIGNIRTSVGSIASVIGIGNVMVFSKLTLIAHMSVGNRHVMIATFWERNKIGS